MQLMHLGNFAGSMAQEKDWFRIWFNSPYYHQLYAHRDEVEAKGFVDRIVRHLDLPTKAKVLDLACGMGRHAIRLHANGLEVLGVDLSSESIAAAGKHQRLGLRFKVHDMRQPLVEGDFEAVFNLFTSFGYFRTEQEDVDVLAAVYDSLLPQGKLVLDYLNSERKGLLKRSKEVKVINGTSFTVRKWVESSTFIKRIEVDGQRFEERVRAYTAKQLEAMLHGIGFQVKDVFGNYALGAFENNSSDRAIFVAEK